MAENITLIISIFSFDISSDFLVNISSRWSAHVQTHPHSPSNHQFDARALYLFLFRNLRKTWTFWTTNFTTRELKCEVSGNIQSHFALRNALMVMSAV